MLFLSQTRRFSFGERKPCLRLLTGERCLALGERIDCRFSFLSLDFGHLEIDLGLAEFLAPALELAFNRNGVEADKQIALVHARSLCHEKRNLGFASKKR